MGWLWQSSTFCLFLPSRPPDADLVEVMSFDGPAILDGCALASSPSMTPMGGPFLPPVMLLGSMM